MKIKYFVLSVFVAATTMLFAQTVRNPTPEVFVTSRDSLSQLKAVLIVGPIQDGTADAIKETQKIADILRNAGVCVIELYEPDANWNEIIEASWGANIFFYRGHGTNFGKNGTTGGLVLSNDEFISSEQIEKYLNLAENSLIIFQSVCRGAGSSAGDNFDIGIKEATQRVGDYSNPFIKSGSQGYIAFNTNHTIWVLRLFFNKKNLQEIYDETLSYNAKTEFSGNYSGYDNFKIFVSSKPPTSGKATRISYINGIRKVEEIPSIKTYDQAYVGNPEFSIDVMLNNEFCSFHGSLLYAEFISKASEFELKHHYFEAFTAQRQALLCSDAPPISDSKQIVIEIYQKLRKYEKLHKPYTALDYMSNPVKNRALAYKGAQYFVVDNMGNPVGANRFKNLLGSGALGFCFIENGKYGITDINGNVVINAIYDVVQIYGDSVFQLYYNGTMPYLEKNIQVLPANNQDTAWRTNLNIAIFNKHYGIVNRKGEIMLNYQFDTIYWACNRQWLIVEREGKYGIFNPDKNMMLKACAYEKIPVFEKDFIIISQNKNGYLYNGVLHRNGKTIVPVQYDYVQEVASGEFMAYQKTKDRYSYFDIKGKKMPVKYQYQSAFKKSMQAYEENNKKKPAKKKHEKDWNSNNETNNFNIQSLIVNDTLMPSFLRDTLFLLGKHLVTYEEFLNMPLSLTKQWGDSASFEHTLMFSLCAAFNHARNCYYELTKSSLDIDKIDLCKPIILDSYANATAYKLTNDILKQQSSRNTNIVFKNYKQRMKETGCNGYVVKVFSSNSASLRQFVDDCLLNESVFNAISNSETTHLGVGYKDGYFTVLLLKK